MSMNTIIREKRKELGLTQEQVAAYLGVSTPAVNKWEKGSTYPDVTLLPPLARLLKTDLNTLLCFHEEMSQKEISLFLNRVTDISHKEGLESAFEMAMEKVREYPANAELLHSLAMVLQGSLMMVELTSVQKETYDAQITSLYERVAKCNDPKYSDLANYMLASKLITAGDYAKAQQTLNTISEYNALDKRSLQANLWIKEGKNEEAARLLEHKIMANLQGTQVALASLARIAVQEGDEPNSMRLALCGQKEAELFGLWEYSSFLVPLETAMSRRNVEDSLSTLKSMLAALLIPWDMNKSPICKHIRLKETDKNFGAQFLRPVLSELENSPEYDFLRAESEFWQLLNQYRSKC